MEVLQGHIVDQFIIAALQEGGIDREDRDHPLAGQPRGHGHTVSLRDRHVKEPLRELLGKTGKPRTVRHGGGNGADPAVPGGTVCQSLTENGGKALA